MQKTMLHNYCFGEYNEIKLFCIILKHLVLWKYIIGNMYNKSTRRSTDNVFTVQLKQIQL